MFDLFCARNFTKIRHITILGPNLATFLIFSRCTISNIIFMVDELDLLWMPNFIAWEYTSFLGPSFPGMRELILNLMSNVSYLAVILGFLVVTACYLLVTGCYLEVLVVTAHHPSLLLVPTFSINEKGLQTWVC